MQHSYDLLLVSKTAGETVALEGPIAALAARQISVSPEGRGTWKLLPGEVSVAPLMEEGAIRGLDFRVPFHDKTDLVEAVVKELLEVAEASGLRVMDPQRRDSVSLASLSGVVDEYLRMARYAGEYGGVSEALGLSSHAALPTQDSSSFRWLMALLVFFVALYAGWRTITTLQTLRQAATDEPPGAVNVAPKVPGP